MATGTNHVGDNEKAVRDSQMSKKHLNTHISYCKYGITKKRAICTVVNESTTTLFASISGGRVEDLGDIVGDIIGLNSSKKIRSGDTTVDETVNQSVSSALTPTRPFNLGIILCVQG